MKPLRHEIDLVLSKTECEEGKDLEEITYFFNTCFVVFFYFSDVASGLTCPPRGWNIYTLRCLYYLCSAVESRTKRLCSVWDHDQSKAKRRVR